MLNTNASKKTAIIVGILFIIATAFLFIGESFYGPILNSPDYLEIAYQNRMRVVLGILLEFTCVFAITLIPVFLYPILKKYSESLALSYIVFRLFEAILFSITQLDKLSLVNVSQGYIESGGANSYFVNMGDFIQSKYIFIFSFYLLVFTIGGLFFYSLLYKSRLIPKWISGWGFGAAALLLTGSVLNIFEVELGFSGAGFEIIFATPIAIQEMVMAVWLIIKGFNEKN
jgi:hypothetical protein